MSGSLKHLATESIRKNISNLSDVLSTEETLRDVVIACEEAKLITTSNKKELFDNLSGRSTQARANKLIEILQSVVSFKPEHLDTLLVIVRDKGGAAGSVVAGDIAREYGRSLPKYTSTPVSTASTNSQQRETHNVVRGHSNPSQILQSNSDRLAISLSLVLHKVTNDLHAKQLIPLTTKDKVLVTGVLTDYMKASELLTVLQRQLEVHPDPVQYLSDICIVFQNQHDQTLTGIATSILQQLNQPVMLQATGHIIQPSAISRNGNTTSAVKSVSEEVTATSEAVKIKDSIKSTEEIAVGVLRKQMSSIMAARLNFDSIVEKLHSIEVLDEADKRKLMDKPSGLTEDERIRDLIELVIASVRLDVNVFSQFIEILKEQGNKRSKDLGKKLEEAYSNELL